VILQVEAEKRRLVGKNISRNQQAKNHLTSTRKEEVSQFEDCWEKKNLDLLVNILLRGKEIRLKESRRNKYENHWWRPVEK